MMIKKREEKSAYILHSISLSHQVDIVHAQNIEPEVMTSNSLLMIVHMGLVFRAQRLLLSAVVEFF